MSSAEVIFAPAKDSQPVRSALVRTSGAWRMAVYIAASAAAVIANCLMGKEMMGDTLNYHLYAGFSALHGRFGQDYFPAGPQSYFNPYVYVPFYLLATSGLSALAASTILAIVQSAVLWLTFELALEVAPQHSRRVQCFIGACAVLLAFANPILIGQLGSSYADVTTSGLVLAGWLLLLRAIRLPGRRAVIGAGLILGAAAALKLTNAGHALCGFVLLAFIPGSWRVRARHAAAYGAAMAAGLAVPGAPWAVHLQKMFGNPLFPLLNGVFRSPQYPTDGMLDYRFIPDSIAAALWRPFALLAPARMVDNEFPSPDLRYALLAILVFAAVARWAWLRLRRAPAATGLVVPGSTRALAALGSAFLADWILWLKMSGNGRYFIPMACVAAVIAIVLIFRLLAAHPKVRNYALAAVIGVQAIQLSMGAVFRSHVRWDGGPWFEVSVPARLAAGSDLYFTFGDAPSAFIAAFLPRGSGLVNIGGSYELAPHGANGARVASLIRRYAPHLRMLMRDPRTGIAAIREVPELRYVNDALEPFDLRADPRNCARIGVADVIPGVTPRAARLAAARAQSLPDTGYLLTCHVAPDPRDHSALRARQRVADIVFDRIESACPELFLPGHQATRNYSGRNAQVWVRQYPGTGLDIFIGPGGIEVADFVRGGAPDYLGRERDWLHSPPRLRCGRVGQRYYARVLRKLSRGGTT